MTAGPPRILREIVESYNCEIGTYQFRNKVFLAEDNGIADRVLGFIKNSSRKIPVLVLTELNGRTAIDPQNVLDYLLGLALVVRFRGNTSRRIGEATGRPCFDGSMRFYWPGDSAGKYYSQNDATRNSLTRFQKDCIENAELHDLNGDFEQIFSAARTKVIREQRIERAQAAQSDTAAQLARATERITELESKAQDAEAKHSQTVDELLERLNSARANSTSDSDRDKEFRRQRAEIASLRGIRKKLEDANGELRRIQKVDEDTIEKLTLRNKELAAANMPAIAGNDLDDGLQLTGTARIDNITILNHAINIYRDPARRYVINSLRKRYEDVADLCDVIERIMNSDDDVRRLREAKIEKRPQDGIDVNHFEHIIMDNRACFAEKPRLSTRMSDVRQVRNTAAHPKYNGIDSLRAKDGINKVARALREMDNNDDSKLVERLLSLVR
ncbi:MAG: hypothetical protein OXI16_00910 [Chloroflexota bacterium]|nr:hypothetical protein [Chloroflexota bacterium]